MQYAFDEIIERRNTNAMNTDGFRQYIFHADETMQFPYADEDFVRMWVADMEFAVAPEIIEAIEERLKKRIFGYTKVFDPAYYEAFRNWCEQRYGWHPEKAHLVTSPGVIPALYELTGYLCQSSDQVLILTPSYAYFKHAVDFHALQTVCSDLKEENGYYTIDFEDFAKKAADPHTKLCIFCNPHNPTGRVWHKDELLQVAQICKENDLWLISDEIHCDILRIGQTHTPMAKVMPDYDKIITCMAASKSFNLAGLMFSNVIIPNDKLRETWKKRHYDFENPLSIAATQAAYTKGGAWLDAMRQYLDENFAFCAAFIQEHLPRATFRIPEATYLAWVDISAYVSEEENLPLLFANEAGVLLEGGDMFVANSNGYIRLNLACPRSILQKGLTRIADLLAKR